MKRKLFLLPFMLLLVSCNNSCPTNSEISNISDSETSIPEENNKIRLLQSETAYDYSGEIERKEVNEYDDKGRLTFNGTYYFNEDIEEKMQLEYYTTFEYDDLNLVMKDTYHYFDEERIDYSFPSNYTFYNEKGNEIRYEAWDEDDGVPYMFSYTLVSYDSLDRMTNRDIYRLNSNDEFYIAVGFEFSYYNDTELLETEIGYENDKTGNYEFYWKDVYTYDEHNNLISNTYFSGNNSEDLEEIEIYRYEYDDKNRLIKETNFYVSDIEESIDNITTYQYFDNTIIKNHINYDHDGSILNTRRTIRHIDDDKEIELVFEQYEDDDYLLLNRYSVYDYIYITID